MVKSFTDLLPLNTNLSMTTDEFQPTANFVPSRKTNSPSPVLEVRIRSSRCTGDLVASERPLPVTEVLMRIASPTCSSAASSGTVPSSRAGTTSNRHSHARIVLPTKYNGAFPMVKGILMECPRVSMTPSCGAPPVRPKQPGPLEDRLRAAMTRRPLRAVAPNDKKTVAFDLLV